MFYYHNPLTFAGGATRLPSLELPFSSAQPCKNLSKFTGTVEHFARFCFVVKTSADKMIWQIFDNFSHDFSLFSTQLTLFSPKNSIGVKKDWIHVRKGQKFANSRCRPTFSQRNKTSGNIPLCKVWRSSLRSNLRNCQCHISLERCVCVPVFDKRNYANFASFSSAPCTPCSAAKSAIKAKYGSAKSALS